MEPKDIKNIEESEHYEMSPIYLLLTSGEQLLGLGCWKDLRESDYIILDPLLIVKYFNNDSRETTFMLRNWLYFSDDRLVEIPKTSIITISSMADKYFDQYNKTRQNLYEKKENNMILVKEEQNEETTNTKNVEEIKPKMSRTLH